MIGLVTTVIATAVSLPLAVLNSKFNYSGKSILSALLLVPMVMPPFVEAIGIQDFLHALDPSMFFSSTTILFRDPSKLA